MLLVGFTLLIASQRLLELRLAKRNEAWARARGAVEYGREHYPLLVALHAAWLAGLMLEGFARGARLAPGWPVWLGVFLLAQAGRYWAISSLGPYWNTRVLVVLGGVRVARGPYRFLRHPNYLAVALELLSAPLVFGAWLTALAATASNAALLLLVRIPTEERALQRYRASS